MITFIKQLVTGRFAMSFLAVCVLMSSLVGCGQENDPNIGSVTGIVTLNGTPLSGVEIVFQPESGRPSLGVTDSSGRYELSYSAAKKGALIGIHSVSIVPPTVDSETPSKPNSTIQIPEKYNVTTELTAEVKSGRNTLNFDLTSK